MKEVWSLRVRLQLANKRSDLALFTLALDSELRGCDLDSLRVRDIYQGTGVATRKLGRGELPLAGAMPCIGLLTLEEYLAELGGGLSPPIERAVARGPAELAEQSPFPL